MTNVDGGLITLEYAAEGLHMRDAGTGSQGDRDADLTTFIQAATPVIEDLIGPVIAANKTLAFDGGTYSIVLPDRANAIVSVTEAGNLLTAGSYFFDPVGSIVYGGNMIYPRLFYPGRLAIVITYSVGYGTVPVTIQLAARELVRFWWQQGMNAQRPAYSDAVETAAPMGFAVPKRVVEMLTPYMGTVGFA
ncbi:hypothetical protein ACFRFH_12115 [Leifsonia sp. NPDC056824]|uniref:hypothetical protein n=1 Tax=Leifsonia sp. NPDC056824 TaxID=3345953 RepID=UPI0036AEDE2A